MQDQLERIAADVEKVRFRLACILWFLVGTTVASILSGVVIFLVADYASQQAIDQMNAAARENSKTPWLIEGSPENLRWRAALEKDRQRAQQAPDAE